MLWNNLDSIARRTLLENGLPLHYYLEYLLHASSCVRDLSKDTLQIVNTVLLPINSYFAADLPLDFVDDVLVGIPVGQQIQPISKKDSLSPLRVHDSTGQFVPYSQIDDVNQQTYYGFPNGWTFWWNINDYGEPTGRWFGANGGAKANGYKIVRERSLAAFGPLLHSIYD